MKGMHMYKGDEVEAAVSMVMDGALHRERILRGGDTDDIIKEICFHTLCALHARMTKTQIREVLETRIDD